MPVAYLVVDDDPDIQELLVDILQGPGISVHVADDGFDALSAFEAHRFDVVVTDVQMPRMTGLELARRLRKKHARLVIIILSGRAKPSAEVWAASGGDIFLAKPFTRDDLLDAIAGATLKRAQRS